MAKAFLICQFIVGWRSYSDSLEKVFKEDLVVNTSLDDLFIIRQVDQHCEGILGDCCIILDQKLEIRDRLERVALEQTRLSGTESNQVLGSCQFGSDNCSYPFMSRNICTDLANLGVAMVKELNELECCQQAIPTQADHFRLTSSSSEGMIVNYVVGDVIS